MENFKKSMQPSAYWNVSSSQVPDYVRQFIVENYGVSPDATMYINLHEPSKVYIMNNNCLQFVDFASPPISYASATTNIGSLPPNSPSVYESPAVFVCANNCPAPSNPIAPVPFVQASSIESQQVPLSNLDPPKFSSNNDSLKKISQLEKTTEATKVSQERRNVSRGTRNPLHIFSSEWHKLSDNEREAIQKERRKANAYKTALCQSFKETGSCEYGDECCFAHGESELRLPPEAHPKYKTQLCNKFSVNGYCPYGSRCQFIHQKPNETIATKAVRKNHYNATPRKNNRSSAAVGNVRRRNATSNKFVRETLTKKGNAVSANSEEKCRDTASRDTSDNAKKSVTGTSPKHSTPVMTKLKREGKAVADKIQSKKGICGMFEDLFLNDTNISFSQSCFPRLTVDSEWSKDIKTEM